MQDKMERLHPKMMKASDTIADGPTSKMDVKRKLEGIVDFLPMMKGQEKLVRDQISRLPSLSTQGI